jgi:hypothetical protein
MATRQHQEREADRARIRKSDPIGFLIACMEGNVPIRDPLTNAVTGFEKVDPALRAAAATKLLERVVPSLKSVEVDAAGGAVSFQIVSPFPLPGSLREPNVIEGTIDHGQLNDGLQQLTHVTERQPKGTDR